MLYDWSRSGVDLEKFPFWSRAELLRISVIAGLAIVPVSVAAIDAPKPKPTEMARDSDAAPLAPSGRLLSTRQVAFDIKTLDLAALGDAEPEVQR